MWYGSSVLSAGHHGSYAWPLVASIFLCLTGIGHSFGCILSHWVAWSVGCIDPSHPGAAGWCWFSCVSCGLVERLVHLVILWWTPSSSCHTWHSASLIRLHHIQVTRSGCKSWQSFRSCRMVWLWLAGNGPHVAGREWHIHLLMCVRVRTC